MALSLSYDCPHCSTKKAGFSLCGETDVVIRTRTVWHAFYVCSICNMPLIASITGLNNSPSNLNENLSDARLISVDFFPETLPVVAPEHVPERVANAFIQAEQNIRTRNWDAAGAMDRRALEIATKEQAPDRAKDTLYKRIEHLASIGKLTQSLKDWAHNLRLVGNDAVHDEDGLDETEARQAHELTKFILIYLYTLPQQVLLAQQQRIEEDA